MLKFNNKEELSPANLERIAGFNKSKLIKERANEEKELENIKKNIDKDFQEAPIILASTHGFYELRDEPEIWTVPANTYIFETHTIGDMGSSKIDEPIRILSQGVYRKFFINYFLGNRDFFRNRKGALTEDFVDVFKNFTFYTPGDKIAERYLAIGGGRADEKDLSSRTWDAYVNMGFYKFDRYAKPQFETIGGQNRKIKSEILISMRTQMVEDKDFYITNRELVELITDGTPIEYSGKKQLHSARTFTYEKENEPRIFIFSSCAAANCNNLKNSTGKLIPDPYQSPLCNERLQVIEKIQAQQHLKLRALGIQTGPGGFDFLGNNIEGYKPKHLVEARNLRFKTAKSQQAFALNKSKEKYSSLDKEIKNWWKLVNQPLNNNRTRKNKTKRKESSTLI